MKWMTILPSMSFPHCKLPLLGLVRGYMWHFLTGGKFWLCGSLFFFSCFFFRGKRFSPCKWWGVGERKGQSFLKAWKETGAFCYDLIMMNVYFISLFSILLSLGGALLMKNGLFYIFILWTVRNIGAKEKEILLLMGFVFTLLFIWFLLTRVKKYFCLL